MIPFISIIVPVYNTESYLNKCIDSLINQTISNIEILIINDGSPDNCQQIIDAYVLQYPGMVRGYSKVNGGLGDARNFALPYAKGEYIGFIDSDDYIHPAMYETLYSQAVKNKSDIAICEFTFVDENGYTLNNTNICAHTDISKKDKKYALKYGRNEAFNKIYKRELFQNSEIRYPKIWFEDYPTTPLLIEKANNICYVDTPLYYYVQRKGSIMNQAATFSNRNFEILLATELIVNSRDLFEPEDYLFYMNEVAPIHAFIRFYKNIITIRDKRERTAIIKKWGQELNRLIPGWETSAAVVNLKKRIRNPFKGYIFTIIVNAYRTGNTGLLNFLFLGTSLKL